jgi:clan AA aspartic protease
MITGEVREDEARVRLRIRGPGGRQHEIEAVIDTGYNGWLTLPPALIARLRLLWQNFVRGVMADGSEDTFNVYEATVMWDRRIRLIPVTEADSDPLVGMALLKGYEVNMEVRPRGKITIKRLP